MMEKENSSLSVRRQCQLLSLARSRLYYRARPESAFNLHLMQLIDQEFTDHPFTGVERMVAFLWREHGLRVNHKRVRRLMRKMGLMALYPKPRTSYSAPALRRYPCLLDTITIDARDMVWCSDITYLRLKGGFMYLVAVMDYFSRYVLSWSVSNSLESLFCLDALAAALSISTPRIFHSDQGKQYTCGTFVEMLQAGGIAISMSGKGRAYDNILVERLWRTVKQEEVYLKEYSDGHDVIKSLRRYFDYYNERRPHSSLGCRTPAEVYGRGRSSLCVASAPPSLGKAKQLDKSLQLTPIYRGKNGLDNG